MDPGVSFGISDVTIRNADVVKAGVTVKSCVSEAKMDQREGAYQFLAEYELSLRRQLPPAQELDGWVCRTNTEARLDYGRRHLRKPEAAFLNHFAVPHLHELLVERGLLTALEAKKAILNEYHVSMKEFSETSPARTTKHPFTKMLGTGIDAIYEGWSNPNSTSALVQSCPDFALRHPFAHTIVFEGKYFRQGSLQYAKRQLVKDIYQAFFYRGLPPVAETAKGRAAWGYDYSCLMAYDASPTGTLLEAWNGLPAKVRNGFWSGANIYVMILGGDGRV